MNLETTASSNPTALDLEAANRSDRAYRDDEEFVHERSGYRGAIVCCLSDGSGGSSRSIRLG